MGKGVDRAATWQETSLTRLGWSLLVRHHQEPRRPGADLASMCYMCDPFSRSKSSILSKPSLPGLSVPSKTGGFLTGAWIWLWRISDLRICIPATKFVSWRCRSVMPERSYPEPRDVGSLLTPFSSSRCNSCRYRTCFPHMTSYGGGSSLSSEITLDQAAAYNSPTLVLCQVARIQITPAKILTTPAITLILATISKSMVQEVVVQQEVCIDRSGQ